MSSYEMHKNIFEQHKKKTILIIVLVVVLVILVSSELILEKVFGLGNPVLYDSSALYGYRPLPNQNLSRFFGAKLRFNNLGLRSEEDWNDRREDKILFLGDSVTYGGSYITNKELFSHLAVIGLGGYKSGNAGVNAWGVENIYGLIVETNFLPAKIYVTTLPEGDFYRGLNRLQGLPYFNLKPRFAFSELWYFFCYLQSNHRYLEWTSFANGEETKYVVRKAVKKLKLMDDYLRQRGFQHLIFITPSLSQVVKGEPKDPLVKNLLMDYHLTPYYILDELSQYNLSESERRELFYDNIHLERKGHAVWARIIRSKLDLIIPH